MCGFAHGSERVNAQVEKGAADNHILNFFGQGNIIFINEQPGKSQGILKRDIWGSHVQDSTDSFITSLASVLKWDVI